MSRRREGPFLIVRNERYVELVRMPGLDDDSTTFTQDAGTDPCLGTKRSRQLSLLQVKVRYRRLKVNNGDSIARFLILSSQLVFLVPLIGRDRLLPGPPVVLNPAPTLCT